jgi:hypothetical protein
MVSRVEIRASGVGRARAAFSEAGGRRANPIEGVEGRSFRALKCRATSRRSRCEAGLRAAEHRPLCLT